MTDILKVKTQDGWQGIAVVQGDVEPTQSDWNQDNTDELDYIKNKPEKLSDFTDDTSTNPIDKADTLTGLTSSIAELNYCDGVSSNIQTQLDGKVNLNLANASLSSSFATALNSAGIVTVVESNRSGNSWYRVYSDGWCVQGGLHAFSSTGWEAVTLAKSYVDTYYSVLAVNAGENTNRYHIKVGNHAKNAVDKFYVTSAQSGTSVFWKTEGYIS